MPQKLWNFHPPPDTLAGMDKTIETFLTIVHEAILSRAALHTQRYSPSASSWLS